MAKKSFVIEWRCHQFLSAFLASGHLPRVSYQSGLSGNDKGDNEGKPGSVNGSPGINLATQEKPGKSQLGKCLIKAVRSVIA